MAEIGEMLASNDPMSTPVMGMGPAPPMNTAPSGGMQENTAILHERSREQQMMPQPQARPKGKPPGPTAEQREAFIVACCAFIVLVPNMQQLLLSNVPALASNTTLLTLANAALIAVVYFFLKEHALDLI